MSLFSVAGRHKVTLIEWVKFSKGFVGNLLDEPLIPIDGYCSFFHALTSAAA
jgi:hypothetical protein